jgi:hypothetical protein
MMGVLRQCNKRSIVALPVFDCVVVRASAEEAATKIMKQQFRKVAGLDAEVRLEMHATNL